MFGELTASKLVERYELAPAHLANKVWLTWHNLVVSIKPAKS
jgi:hypothetical protein